jgi:hypothetical protein
MSTRANIIIKDDYSELWFYRHSDGYPEGTMPTLEKFLAWVKEGKIRDNAQQSAGWLIIIGAEEYKEHQIKRPEKSYEPLTPEQEKEWAGKIPTRPLDDNFSGWKVGAYEPSHGQYGDIEYLYTIDLVTKTIKIEEV